VNTVMKTRIVKIGNSRGIRIPKLLLEQISFGEEVELEVQQDRIVIRPAQRPRCSWEEQFSVMAQHGDDRLLDREVLSLTSWDKDEWEW